MADERQFGTQELFSARYLAEVETDCEPELEPPADRVRPSRSFAEQTIRWLTPLVAVMLIAAVGGLYWLNRDAFVSKAGELKKRRSVVDMVLWACGSKETFNSALSKRLEKAQRDSAYQFDQMKPAYKTEFDHVDLQNLSQSWNGGR